MKEIVAKELASRVRDGEVLGVGTGSTVDAALVQIGARIKNEGLRLKVVPTSLQSSWRCQELGLDVLYPGFCDYISWGFDGADEVNEDLWLIKGKGGALLQEKILAARCRSFVVIVDESKVVKQLGQKCPIPVEVIPEARMLVEREMKKLGATAMTIREGSGKHGPVITEAGNIIIDISFPGVERDLEQRIKSVLGVVESGLFIGYTSELLIGSASGVTTKKPR